MWFISVISGHLDWETEETHEIPQYIWEFRCWWWWLWLSLGCCAPTFHTDLFRARAFSLRRIFSVFLLSTKYFIYILFYCHITVLSIFSCSFRWIDPIRPKLKANQSGSLARLCVMLNHFCARDTLLKLKKRLLINSTRIYACYRVWSSYLRSLIFFRLRDIDSYGRGFTSGSCSVGNRSLVDKCREGWGIEPRQRLCSRRQTTLADGFRIWENRPCSCNNIMVFVVELKNLC